MAPQPPLPPYFEGLPRRVTAHLDTESDRGVILILSAYLDEILSQLVAASCTSSAASKPLLEFRGPAGSFGAKIQLCRAFGLICEETARRLNLVRKIRNEAAHFDTSGRGFDVLFDSTPTMQRVAELATGDGPAFSDAAEARQSFIVSGRGIASLLLLRIATAPRAVAPESPKESRELLRGTRWGDRLDMAEAGDIADLQALWKDVQTALSERLSSLEDLGD